MYGMIDFNDNILNIVNEILSDDTVELAEDIPVKTNKKSK